ncbi:glycosyltransferase family 4 protein [Candidatus Halobonum tyrrellensis]|uniref:Hexosyltransferase n=1 Tax=Candidatus Halobonum tyrrellensis G22 TaxID=1324957 RepID=V4J3T3_9EURY|nr:glycosyltransferase family 4 protein [Candidatus Halobonum tyrrellensis]ESP90037.1 hexosyltransferase [Candidatus Halobonum tyrrellensis G22]
MNILYMVSRFPSLSESFVINEIYELEQRGHDVSVFAQERPDEEIAHDEVAEMDLTVHYAGRPSLRSFPELLSRRVLNPTILRQSAYVDDPLSHAAYLYFGKELMRAVEAEGDVDLIHAHFAFPTRIAATYVANYFDIPCTLTAHAYEIFASPNMRRLRRLLSRLDHVVVPSEYNKRYLREDLEIETDVSVVPATIDVDKFQPSDDCVSGRLLTVARLVEKKGHEYAIDAVADLLDRGYDVEYHIVGTGEREAFLRERVRERGVEEAVEFLGHVSDDRLQRELHEAELFVLPCVITANGDRDITPVALREAMATRTACVSTTISAIPEVITDGHDGRLVDPNDAVALADALADLLDDPARRRTLAGNARETVETKFDIATAVDDLEAVFDRVS